MSGKGNTAQGSAGKAASPMTTDAAGRVQAAEAKAGDGGVDKGGFAARAQAAAAKNSSKWSATDLLLETVYVRFEPQILRVL